MFNNVLRHTCTQYSSKFDTVYRLVNSIKHPVIMHALWFCHSKSNWRTSINNKSLLNDMLSIDKSRYIWFFIVHVISCNCFEIPKDFIQVPVTDNRIRGKSIHIDCICGLWLILMIDRINVHILYILHEIYHRCCIYLIRNNRKKLTRWILNNKVQMILRTFWALWLSQQVVSCLSIDTQLENTSDIHCSSSKFYWKY